MPVLTALVRHLAAKCSISWPREACLEELRPYGQPLADAYRLVSPLNTLTQLSRHLLDLMTLCSRIPTMQQAKQCPMLEAVFLSCCSCCDRTSCYHHVSSNVELLSSDIHG